jgi:hypothetical protein
MVFALLFWFRDMGVDSQVKMISIDGQIYLAYDVCKPHACDSSMLSVIFSTGGENAWAVSFTNGATGPLPPGQACAGCIEGFAFYGDFSDNLSIFLTLFQSIAPLAINTQAQ